MSVPGKYSVIGLHENRFPHVCLSPDGQIATSAVTCRHGLLVQRTHVALTISETSPKPTGESNLPPKAPLKARRKVPW